MISLKFVYDINDVEEEYEILEETINEKDLCLDPLDEWLLEYGSFE